MVKFTQASGGSHLVDSDALDPFRLRRSVKVGDNKRKVEVYALEQTRPRTDDSRLGGCELLGVEVKQTPWENAWTAKPVRVRVNHLRLRVARTCRLLYGCRFLPELVQYINAGDSHNAKLQILCSTAPSSYQLDQFGAVSSALLFTKYTGDNRD